MIQEKQRKEKEKKGRGKLTIWFTGAKNEEFCSILLARPCHIWHGPC